MKKFIFLIIYLLLTISLFGQNKNLKEKGNQSINRNTFRIFPEILFIFEENQESKNISWNDTSFGIVFSYSRLFSNNFGMTFGTGFYVFQKDENGYFSSDSNASTNKLGLSLMVGPYFRYNRLGISPLLKIYFIDGKSDSSITDNSLEDQYLGSQFELLGGLGCNIEYFITDFLTIYIEASILGGTKWESFRSPESSMSGFFLIPIGTSNESESIVTNLFACSFSIGMGFAF